MRTRLLPPLALLLVLAVACDDPSGPGRTPADARVVSGSAQSGPAGLELPAPLVVRVLDARGRPVIRQPVSWVVTAGGGSLRAASDRTEADGEALAAWILGPVAGDTQRVEARVLDAASGEVRAVARFTAVATAGAAAALQAVAGDGAEVPAGTRLPDSLVVRAVDGHGNAVAGVVVVWTGSTGSVSPAVSTTRMDGTARTAYTAGAVGQAAVTAAAEGLQPAAFSVTVLPRAVYLRVLAPAADAVVGDSAVVTVRVDSAQGSVASVVASAGGRSTTLAPAVGGTLSGTLALEGAPFGPLLLQVTATTASGDTAIATVPIVHDAPPVVTIALPTPGFVARPEIRVQAACGDDDPAGCRELVVLRTAPGTPPVVVASGVHAVDATVSLAPLEGRAVALEFRGRDSRGRVTAVTRHGFVESSPALAEAASAGTRLLDLAGDRILYADSLSVLRIRAGAAETVVGTGGARGRSLHPAGTLFAAGSRLRDWRGGSTVDLGPVNAEYRVAGGWAIWSDARDLYRRDLVAGTHVLVSSRAINNGNDVTEDGVVVYATGRGNLDPPGGDFYDIYRFAGGVTTRITADADAEHWNIGPRTDGTNVVYFKTTQGGSTSAQSGRLALWRDGVETLLTTTLRPFVDYGVAGGWVAFTDADGGGILQIHVRAPSGEVRRVTSSGTSARLLAVGEDGTVVYTAGGSAYALRAPHTGTAVRIGTDWPETYGEYRFVDGELLLFLGRSVFRAAY